MQKCEAGIGRDWTLVIRSADKPGYVRCNRKATAHVINEYQNEMGGKPMIWLCARCERIALG